MFLKVHFHPFRFLKKLHHLSPWFPSKFSMTMFVLMKPVLNLALINHQKEVPAESILHIRLWFQEATNGFLSKSFPSVPSGFLMLPEALTPDISIPNSC